MMYRSDWFWLGLFLVGVAGSLAQLYVWWKI